MSVFTSIKKKKAWNFKCGSTYCYDIWVQQLLERSFAFSGIVWLTSTPLWFDSSQPSLKCVMLSMQKSVPCLSWLIYAVWNTEAWKIWPNFLSTSGMHLAHVTAENGSAWWDGSRQTWHTANTILSLNVQIRNANNLKALQLSFTVNLSSSLNVRGMFF